MVSLEEIKQKIKQKGYYHGDIYQKYCIQSLTPYDKKLCSKLEKLKKIKIKGSTVADIGANLGYFSLWACQQGAKHVWAYETCCSLAELIELQASYHGFRNITITQDDFLKDEKSFDIVIAFSIIHHLIFQKCGKNVSCECIFDFMKHLSRKTKCVAILEYTGDYQRIWNWKFWSRDIFYRACQECFVKVKYLGRSVPSSRYIFAGINSENCKIDK